MNSASLIESSDNAMQDHNAMVTMGFGNNDNATITRKLRQLFSFLCRKAVLGSRGNVASH